MTLLECLESDIFLPTKIVGNEGIIKFFESAFASYNNTINLISDKNLSRELNLQKINISNFCKKIISSLNYHQNDNVESAYSEFKDAMYILKPLLFPENKGQVAEFIGLDKPFYRARTGSTKPYSKGGMFHLPFSKRDQVNTQRFSSPGLPCLYLSNSIYVCWEELNRPPVDELQVSRFQKVNRELNILDLSLTSTQLRIMRKTNPHDEIHSKYDYDFLAFWFLVTWPLSFICSLPVANENASFKQEYIFPQFLLRWVRFEEGVDGIKYFSVKANPYNKEDFAQFTNYVFPPKIIDNGNYCSHLKDSFKLTDPVSIEMFKAADPNFIFITEEWLKNVKYKVWNDILRLELIKGFQMPYTHTIFGKLEVFMQNIDVDFLSEN
jgi:hypothetical protein